MKSFGIVTRNIIRPTGVAIAIACFGLAATSAQAANKDLLDILLQNGVISQSQYDILIEKDSLNVSDLVGSKSDQKKIDQQIEQKVDAAVAAKVFEEPEVKASHTSKGFRFETADGNWQTNLQWRAQLRFTNPSSGDPRQVSAFEDESQSTFEARRLRMKIGGHGFRPWLKYYFEVDLQPTRDVDDSSSSASSRVIDWRIDAAPWEWGGFRLGQWKVDYSRERVDSSGRQQFVERSIANRIFTLDRQVGVQLRGRAFKGTGADLRYYAGVFNGEGRGVRNTDNDLLYVGRLQWNFMGRDLPLRQTDVEYTEKPTGSLAFGAATTTGSCTRFSSSGCGNLDGFESPANAEIGQFDIDQAVQEFAFKYRGFSFQQELHRKTIMDNVLGIENDLTGGYVQSGFFPNSLIPTLPKSLELAARYAFVDEPNRSDRSIENRREEFTLAANWFIKGHNNKITFDVSRLTLEDNFLEQDVSENRVRVQWDVSF